MSERRGLIFDLQHYAVHDGPGIRTLVFLKGCPLRCVWCCNPESQSRLRELRYLRVRCRGCHACVEACPSGAATPDLGGLRLEREICARCNAPVCISACPHNALLAAGEDKSVSEVMARVAADRDFYRNSGGGVTFSGGEPLQQPAFLCELLESCRAEGIHTAVETCGYAAPATVTAVLPLVDLFLFDVKLVDPRRHLALTGTNNELIIENLHRIAQVAPDRLLLRLPLVPGVNDDAANLEAVARLARELDLAIELCPYHRLGHDKYLQLDRRPPVNPPQIEPAALQAALRFFEGRKLTCGLA